MLFNGFDGFLKSDFDLYSEKKSSLSIYNSKRFLVRNKLEELAELLSNDLTDVIFDVSDHSPSGWNNNSVSDQVLYFIRPEKARLSLETLITKEISFKDYIEDSSIFHNHLMLGLRITEDGVLIYLHLNKHAIIDYRNLKSKLEYEGVDEELNSLLNDFSLFDENYNKIKRDQLEKMIESNSSFSIGKFYTKDSKVLETESFIKEFKTTILELKPIYDFILWKSENDNIEIKEEIKENIIIQKQAGLKKGDNVKVLSGIFAGKRGVLNKINKKGKATVNINGIRTTLNASELSKI